MRLINGCEEFPDKIGVLMNEVYVRKEVKIMNYINY